MKNQRTNSLIGLSLALVGIITLWVDRMRASADDLTGRGQAVTALTVIALAVLLVSVIWLSIANAKSQKNKQGE